MLITFSSWLVLADKPEKTLLSKVEIYPSSRLEPKRAGSWLVPPLFLPYSAKKVIYKRKLFREIDFSI